MPETPSAPCTGIFPGDDVLPHSARPVAAASSQAMTSLDQYLIKNVGENVSLDDLSAAVGISKFALTRLFHKRYGVAPMRWLWSFRAHLARDIIEMGVGLPLMDVLTLCGFNSPQHFSRFFRKTFRQAPSRLVKDQTLPEGPKDIQKARQDLYEKFEGIVTASLERYKANYHLELPLNAESTSTFQASVEASLV